MSEKQLYIKAKVWWKPALKFSKISSSLDINHRFHWQKKERRRLNASSNNMRIIVNITLCLVVACAAEEVETVIINLGLFDNQKKIFFLQKFYFVFSHIFFFLEEATIGVVHKPFESGVEYDMGQNILWSGKYMVRETVYRVRPYFKGFPVIISCSNFGIW